MSLRTRTQFPAALSELRLLRREHLATGVTRVTLAGDLGGLPELSGGAWAPDDRVKLFLPDPATGVLTPPRIGADGGILRPADAVSVSRDFTPSRVRAGGAGDAELDLDVVSPGANGPGTEWLLGAEAGESAVLAHPRFSRSVPGADAVAEFVLVADETGFAAAARWLAALDPAIRVSAVFLGEDDGYEEFLPAELRSRASIDWLYRVDGPGQLREAVASIPLGERSFVWAAGEAGELAPIRRELLATLPPERVDLTGHWRRGLVNHDPDLELDRI